MKKIGKKLSYFVKLFLAFSLLFNSVSPFATVLAEELPSDGGTDKVENVLSGSNEETNLENGTEGNEDEGKDTTAPSEEPSEGETTGDGTGAGETTGGETTVTTPENVEGGEETSTDEPGSGDETTTPETGSTDGTTPETTEPSEGTNEGGETAPEEALVFTVEVSGNNAVIKYSKANELSEGNLLITEDFKYLDDSMHGAVNNTIELTEEIKTSLIGEGYTYESSILADNVYDGVYTVTATIGENSESGNKTISQESGVVFELRNNDGDVIEKTDGKYVLDVGEMGAIIWMKVLPGGITPSSQVSVTKGYAPASQVLEAIPFKTINIINYLKGEFTENASVTLDEQQYDETFTILYGAYQDNTDELNEAAAASALDNTYMFFGNTAAGSLYINGDGDLDELKDIVEDTFAYGRDVLECSATEDSNGYVVKCIDEHGVEITYTAAKANEEEKVDANLEIENPEVSVGDEFEVSYVVTLKELMVNGVSGVIDYDKNLLELVNVVANKFAGGTSEDKFLYAGDEVLTGTETVDEDGNTVINEEEYVILTLTFKALSEGTATISVNDSRFYNESIYYESSDEITTEVTITKSSEEPTDDPSEDTTEDSSLSSLVIGGQEISLEDGKFDYEITVPEDTTTIDVDALAIEGAEITSIVYPEELVVGENTVTITVKTADGKTQTYTVKVIRGEIPAEEENNNTNAEVTYPDYTYDNGTYNNDNGNDGKIDDGGKKDDNKDANTDDNTKTKDKGKLQRIVIISLILLVIAGLIYLIFKDDNDDEETKKANKDINKFKNDDDLYSNTNKNNNSPNKNNNRNYKNNNKNNNKKGR